LIFAVEDGDHTGAFDMGRFIAEKLVDPDLFSDRGIDRRYLRLAGRLPDARLLLQFLKCSVKPSVKVVLGNSSPFSSRKTRIRSRGVPNVS
jgi:hypothetical protein